MRGGFEQVLVQFQDHDLFFEPVTSKNLLPLIKDVLIYDNVSYSDSQVFKTLELLLNKRHYANTFRPSCILSKSQWFQVFELFVARFPMNLYLVDVFFLAFQEEDVAMWIAYTFLFKYYNLYNRFSVLNLIEIYEELSEERNLFKRYIDRLQYVFLNKYVQQMINKQTQNPYKLNTEEQKKKTQCCQLDLRKKGASLC